MEGHARPLSLKEINILKNKDARRSQRASMEQPGNSEKQGPRQPMHLLLTTREGRLCSPCHCSDKIPSWGYHGTFWRIGCQPVTVGILGERPWESPEAL